VHDVRACVVIPTLDGRELLAAALSSLDRQTLEADVVVVDNGSSDGTAAMVAERFPRVRVVRLDRNVGFGAAVNRGAAEALDGTDVLVLVNNDVECEPVFVERIVEPFADPTVGMAAGVLLQADDPELVDSAGIELDGTLRSYDALWNEPAAGLAHAGDPVGPCGGAAAYRLDAFRAVGGFDDAFFAYWEDVDLALRLRLLGWRCVLAPSARALHRHGQTVGAGSPRARSLDAYGRGFVLARYRVTRGRPTRQAAVALLDWPALAAHLVARREAEPLRARARGVRAGRARAPLRPPIELATVPLREAVARQWRFLALRLRGRAPRHFYERAGVGPRR
jgi:hypothetical protein